MSASWGLEDVPAMDLKIGVFEGITWDSHGKAYVQTCQHAIVLLILRYPIRFFLQCICIPRYLSHEFQLT